MILGKFIRKVDTYAENEMKLWKVELIRSCTKKFHEQILRKKMHEKVKRKSCPKKSCTKKCQEKKMSHCMKECEVSWRNVLKSFVRKKKFCRQKKKFVKNKVLKEIFFKIIKLWKKKCW